MPALLAAVLLGPMLSFPARDAGLPRIGTALAALGPDQGQVAAWLRGLPPYRSPEYVAAIDAMRKQAPDLDAVLLEVLASKNHADAAKAAETLGYLGSRTAVDALAKTLADPPLPEEEEATVERRGSESDIEGYSVRAVERVYALRAEAATALGRIGGTAAVESLAEVSRSGDLFAARFLAREPIVDPGTRRVLAPEETRRFPRALLAHVARALAAADPVAGTDAFDDALKSQDDLVRENAVRGLARCARNPEARDLLMPLLLDEDLSPDLLREALQIIARDFPYADMRTVVDAFLAGEDCPRQAQGLSVLAIATEGDFDRSPFGADAELRAALARLLKARCFGVATRASLVIHRLGQGERLLHALQERDLATIAEHFVYFVMLGQEGSEPVLIQALEAEGSADMSDAFMLCQNPALVQAGMAWRESPDHAGAETTFERSSRGESLYWGALGSEEEP